MKLVDAFGRLRRRLFPPPQVHRGFREFHRLRAYALAHKPDLWRMTAGAPLAAALRMQAARYGIEIPPNAPLSWSCRRIRVAMERERKH